MAAEEAAEARGAVDVPDGVEGPREAARVLGELRVRGLEEDLDAVEGGYGGFGLRGVLVFGRGAVRDNETAGRGAGLGVGRCGDAYRTASETARDPAFYDILRALLVDVSPTLRRAP